MTLKNRITTWILVVLLVFTGPFGQTAVMAAETASEGSRQLSQMEEELIKQREEYEQNAVPDEETEADSAYTYVPVNPRYDQAVMDEESASWIDEAGEQLMELVKEREIMALLYMADSYPLRSEANVEAGEIITLYSGQLVNILDVYVDNEFGIWEYVRLNYDGVYYEGYLPRANLAVSDQRFLDWEMNYGMNPEAVTYAADGVDAANSPDILEFPASYQAALTALKEAHPTWTFVKMNTTLDWNNVIYNELQGGKSLVHKSLPDWAKGQVYDGGNWYYATQDALQIYIDPRNNLTEERIFQFEQLTYNEQYHTLEAMEKFLNTTFMAGDKPAPGLDTMTFAYMIHAIGAQEGREVSPFHLAARILQEQGQGNSPLISGTVPGYEGYYNYFNIGASGKSNEEVIRNGLEYAKNHNWNNAYMSVQGGADIIAENYIKKGQDTLYLQKFNVNPNGQKPVYTHQYMQNITAPITEAKSVRKLYNEAGALESPFVFKIPVYENMPAVPYTAPVETTDVVLGLPAGYTDTKVWLDGVPYEGTISGGAITVHANDKAAKVAVMYQYNSNDIPVGMYVWTLAYDRYHYVATAQPKLQDLLTYHGFSVRITGKAGIRFKTGINIALRKQLITEGVEGYKLTEYGTLIMTAANSEIYPMVKGGTKTLRGVNYGVDDKGVFQNRVYEAVGDRYRYTAVLTGLPKERFNTEFAFRGYAILEKDGQQYIVYGPKMARSIYYISKQVLSLGTYAPGTDANNYLSNVVAQTEELIRAEEEAKKAEEEAKKKAEEEAKKKAEEEAKKKAEEEAKKKAEEEAKKKAEEEAKKKAEEEAKKKAEEEAKKKAEEEAKKKAEEEAKKAEEDKKTEEGNPDKVEGDKKTEEGNPDKAEEDKKAEEGNPEKTEEAKKVEEGNPDKGEKETKEESQKIAEEEDDTDETH